VDKSCQGFPRSCFLIVLFPDTTELASIAAYEILQGFFSALPQLDSEVESKDFSLATESYGGHYGPTFYRYFYDQNEAIANGSASGKYFNFNSLLIINAIIDEYIQAPYYPIFANNNTYGIKAVNDTVYDYMTFACYMINGCLDQYQYCKQTNRTSLTDQAICSEAQSMCRDNVEAPYYSYGGRGVYDIRHPLDDPTPPDYFQEFLNLASTQEAIGVNTNYTQFSNNEIYFAFQQTGDFVYPIFLEDLQVLLDSPVRIALIYGDAGTVAFQPLRN
jgi:carboxypeptidase C (cathepsin A)